MGFWQLEDGFPRVFQKMAPSRCACSTWNFGINRKSVRKTF